MARILLVSAAVAGCVLAVLAMYAYLYTGRATFFTPGDAQGGYPLGQALLAIIALLFGIVFGGMHKRLQAREGERISVWNELKDLVQSSEFACSVLVAPIVFCGVYVAIKQQPDSVIAFLFAFQNGFFWDQIFARAKPPAPTPLVPEEVAQLEKRTLT